MTLSPSVRIVALAGLLLAVAGAGVLEYPTLKRRFSTPTTGTPPARVATAPAVAAPAPARAKPAFAIPALPPAVHAALGRHRTVVAVVYSSGSPGDRAVLAQARVGAKQAHAGFVPLDVTHDVVAVDVYAWTKQPADPEVLVVKRPGRVAFAIEGATDSGAVAQAATTAK